MNKVCVNFTKNLFKFYICFLKNCRNVVFNFFGCAFCYPHSHCNRGTLEFDILMSKFPKMFDENSVSRLRWEGWKSQPKKIKPTMFLIFSVLSLSPIEGPTMIAMVSWEREGGCGWVIKIAIKKLNRRFRFFRLWFSSSISPINSFENLKFSKLFDEDAVSQIRGSCDCDG